MAVAAVGLALARTWSVMNRRRRIPSTVTVNSSVAAANRGKIAHDGRDPSQVIGGSGSRSESRRELGSGWRRRALVPLDRLEEHLGDVLDLDVLVASGLFHTPFHHHVAERARY